VLYKRRCPHTGITNYFTAANPYIAVGSVSESDMPARFAWRCYIEDEAGGLTSDISMAEAHLRRAIAIRDPAAQVSLTSRAA
jgi:hypothetical protein